MTGAVISQISVFLWFVICCVTFCVRRAGPHPSKSVLSHHFRSGSDPFSHVHQPTQSIKTKSWSYLPRLRFYWLNNDVTFSLTNIKLLEKWQFWYHINPLKKDGNSFFLVHLSTLIECLAYVGWGVAESRLKKSKAKIFLIKDNFFWNLRIYTLIHTTGDIQGKGCFVGHPISESHLRRSEAGERGLDAPSWASQSTAGRPTHQGAWTLSHAPLNITKPIPPSRRLAFSQMWWDL